MENQKVWIIKNQLSDTFFTLFGGYAHFTTNISLAQRFTSERDAVLCEEQYIHTDPQWTDEVDSLPAQLIENGMTVKYRSPEEGEEAMLFKVLDASDQNYILIQCINGTLTLSPIEAVNSHDLEII